MHVKFEPKLFYIIIQYLQQKQKFSDSLKENHQH